MDWKDEKESKKTEHKMDQRKDSQKHKSHSQMGKQTKLVEKRERKKKANKL